MKLKERLLWSAGRIFHLLPADLPITIPTGVNRGFRWFRGAANAPEWMGTYELSKQKVIGGFDLRGKTVFDVGANAGFYTMAFSRLVGPEGAVFAFEPLGRNCDKIVRHLAMNRITNARLVQCALADRPGFSAFQLGLSDFEGKIAASGRYIVPTSTLDAIIADVSGSAPDLVKIDVEGAEASVLRGAGKLMSERKSVLLIALHGTDSQIECFEILQSHGYLIETFDGQTVTSSEAMADEIVARP